MPFCLDTVNIQNSFDARPDSLKAIIQKEAEKYRKELIKQFSGPHKKTTSDIVAETFSVLFRTQYTKKNIDYKEFKNTVTAMTKI